MDTFTVPGNCDEKYLKGLKDTSQIVDVLTDLKGYANIGSIPSKERSSYRFL